MQGCTAEGRLRQEPTGHGCLGSGESGEGKEHLKGRTIQKGCWVLLKKIAGASSVSTEFSVDTSTFSLVPAQLRHSQHILPRSLPSCFVPLPCRGPCSSYRENGWIHPTWSLSTSCPTSCLHSTLDFQGWEKRSGRLTSLPSVRFQRLHTLSEVYNLNSIEAHEPEIKVLFESHFKCYLLYWAFLALGALLPR